MLGVDANMNHPDVLRLGSQVLQANINSPIARAANIPIPYPGFNGNVAQALRKFPQYQAINWRGVPLGRSQYHALEAMVERRFSRGLQGRVGYTFSKLKNNGSEAGLGNDGANGGIQDPANPLVWGVSDDDTPHVLLTGFTWEVPGPKTGVAQQILGGWNVSGIMRYESGRPLSITMNNDLGGLLFNNQKRPNKTGAEGKADFGDFDPFNDRYFNNGAWADPGPLQFGDAPKRDGDVRGFPNFTERHQHLQGLPARGREAAPVRGAVRQYLRPDGLLRAEHELELACVRPGRHAVQYAAVDSVRAQVRLLAGGFAPRPPYTLSRAPLRRRAPSRGSRLRKAGETSPERLARALRSLAHG